MKQKRNRSRLLELDMRVTPKACHYAHEALTHKRQEDIRRRDIFTKLMSDVKTELMQLKDKEEKP